MAVRKNPDGSITVGIIEDEKPVEPIKTTRKGKAKTNGEG
jgi:hypothetical protein